MDKSQIELYNAFESEDLGAFKNLLEDEKLNVNALCDDGETLLNKITLATSQLKKSPEFLYSILKRQDLDINYTDFKNAPAIYNYLSAESAQPIEKLEAQQRDDAVLSREKMIMAIVNRDDFDPNNKIKLVKDGALEELTLLAACLSAPFNSRLLGTILDSGKFNLNEESSLKLYDEPTGENKWSAMEYACKLGNLTVVDELLSRGAKPTERALNILSSRAEESLGTQNNKIGFDREKIARV